MKRGEVWWVDFGPAEGGEMRKTRPAIIVSNDAANRHANRVQVVPITSNAGKLYPCDAQLKIDGKTCRAMADQLMTVSKHRLKEHLGRASDMEIRSLEIAIRIQLGLAV